MARDVFGRVANFLLWTSAMLLVGTVFGLALAQPVFILRTTLVH